jgi:outer membrane protein
MRLLLSICVSLTFGLSLLAQEPPKQAEVLTLEQAIRLAQANNPSLKNAALSTLIDDDKIAEARTYRFPSINLYALGSQLLTPVDFTFDRGAFGTFPGVGPIPAENTKIHTPLRPTLYGLQQISQPLSQQYKIGLNIKQARFSKLVDEAKLQAQRQAIANQVKKAYYALLQSQVSLESSEANLNLYRELDRVVAQRVEQETALKADSLDVKAHLAQEEYNNLSLRNTVASQKEQLNVILGRDVRTDFTPTSAPEATQNDITLEAARSKALSSRPELRQASLTIDQATLNRRITKAGYIPDVSLAFSNLSLTNVNLLPSNVASAGVLITWNPIDWGRRKHELSEDTRKIEQARNSKSDAENQVLAEVGSAYRKLQESRSLLNATTLTVEAEKEKVRVITNRFEQKAALLSDVLQERASLEKATSQHQQALLSYWTAKADFEKALGEE